MKLIRRELLTGAAAMLLTSRFSGAAAAGTRVIVIEGPAFGASWRVTLQEGAKIEAIRRSLQAVITSVDGTMSPFRPDSEISHFNNSPATNWVSLSTDTCRVIKEGLRIARVTGGAFDPTVGGIVGRYGFGPIRRLSRGNHSDISVRVDAARKAHPNMSLDLCGIAKGHALDRMVGVLEGSGISAFLVELGGEVFARGLHPRGRAWQVGIEHPDPGTISFQRIVMLNGKALATSGDRVNSYSVGGRRYGHIIDPHAGLPADSGVASVSVFAPKAITADALATALFALGAQAGAALAARENISALFLLRERTGLREIMTGKFVDHVLA